MIRLYWWLPRDIGGNYGDSLSPWIVSRVFGVPVIHSSVNDADMVAVGSVLPFLPADFAGIVWGSGTMMQYQPPTPNADIRLLRGPVSEAVLQLEKSVPLGDPALLMPRFFDPPGKRYKLGIMPHHSKISRIAALELAEALGGSEVLYIDPSLPVEVVTLNIATCEALITESLHGVIVADAYGVANCRAHFAGGFASSDLKFLDYFTLVGRSPRTLRVSPAGATLSHIIDFVGEQCADRQVIRNIQKTILSTVSS